MKLQTIQARDAAGNVTAQLEVPTFSVLVTVHVPAGKVVEPELVQIAEAAMEAVVPHLKPQTIQRRIERQAASPNMDLVLVRFTPVLPSGSDGYATVQVPPVAGQEG